MQDKDGNVQKVNYRLYIPVPQVYTIYGPTSYSVVKHAGTHPTYPYTLQHDHDVSTKFLHVIYHNEVQ